MSGPLVVNMVGGPGTGKSTTAAGTFCLLKQEGVNAELVTEYAKELVWARSTHLLGNQIYIFGKQYHRIWKLLQDVDVIVTDSPLIMSLYYGIQQGVHFHDLVLETFNSMDNLTFFLNRVKPFNPKGRVQDEEKARQMDRDLRHLLEVNQIPFQAVVADEDAPKAITHQVLDRL